MKIPESHVQRAFDILMSSDHATARAAYEFSEKNLKVVLAKAAAASNAKTVSERENEAMRSPEYMEALENYRLLAKAYFEARDKREAANAVLDGWRTLSADQRALEKVR